MVIECHKDILLNHIYLAYKNDIYINSGIDI